MCNSNVVDGYLKKITSIHDYNVLIHFSQTNIITMTFPKKKIELSLLTCNLWHVFLKYEKVTGHDSITGWFISMPKKNLINYRSQ